MGAGRFIGPKTIEVRSGDGGVRVLHGKRVVINTGTRATIETTPGLREVNPLTHIEALELDRVPEHLVVLGGGFAGLELAQAMRRFGSRVTVVERGPQLAGREDSDVAEEILRLFRDDGIEILLSTDLLEVEGLSGQGIKARVRNSQGERAVKGSDLLVAVGRVPNTQGLGLENTGVEVDERGYIRVNERLQA